ncbi:MAG TPA: HD domain-containing protein [Candidatus Saccharimonadales bacterium]|nr:HD domain-containing protein [Candidatus Saccharimonadales bacterium]
MAADQTPKEVLKKIEFLFERYSLERRATTQPYLLQKAQEKIKDYEYEPEDELVRETLMEHVGSVHVVATALFPYINDPEVDLGEALIMLAIHDIGELITGDEMTFTKKASSKDAEYEAGLKLLDSSYHKLYEKVEKQQGKTAQFAKAVDKITPDVFDYLTPADITLWRYKHFVDTEPDNVIGMIVKHKRPYMLWNPFLTEFHIYLMDKLAHKLGSSERIQ